MKRSFAGLVGIALVAFTGCNPGTPGGPGAPDKDGKKPLYGQAENTFNLSAPGLSMKQGETKEVSIGIKRGKNLDEDVTVTLADMPKGVSFDTDNSVIKRGDTEAKFTFKAGDEAAVGDFTVKVTGHPTKGSDSASEFKLTVVKKDTFTLSAPLLSTTLKQGDTKEVSVGIKRDKNFDQDVALAFAELPTGVTIAPATAVIKHEDANVKLTLKAGNEAAVGDFTVKVTGHPTKGADASTELKITVAKQNVGGAADTTTDALKAKRHEYALEMHSLLGKLDVKYEEWKVRAAKAEGQTKKDLDKKLSEAKVKRDAAASKLDELKKASADRWEKIKEGVGSAFADLKKVLE